MDSVESKDEPASSMVAPSFLQAMWQWARIGLLSFGGPAAQIALMHRIIVDEKRWLSEKQYLNALSFCMLLPGPEAMQLATYAGWRLHGVRGGLVAGLLFVLPGALVVLALAYVYAVYGDVPLLEALFFGIKAAVLVIVIEALLRISKRALTGITHRLIACLAFIGIFFLQLSFPLIIGLSALAGFLLLSDTEPSGSQTDASSPAEPLAYLAQDVVTQFGWLTAAEMMDGLALAETTPGPLILVTEFVGFLAGYRDGGLSMGLAAALVTLWVTFVPCFLWIFAGAPYIEWIGQQPYLRSALSAITAAVVGVILNLSLWFALHVFFRVVNLKAQGALQFWQPQWSSVDWRIILITLICAFLVFARHWSVIGVLAIASCLGIVLHQLPA